MSEHIMIMKGSASVESSIMTKDLAVAAISNQLVCSLDEIAVFGDEGNDLPMLTIEGIALAGAPSNASAQVKDILKAQQNGYISSFEVCDGFFDFYQQATELGVRAVITDRDGCLKAGSRVHWGPKFGELAMKMGGDLPYIFVVTASSKAQNDKFREEYGLDSRVSVNPEVQRHPWILFAEGGAVKVNILTGDTRNHAGQLNPELFRIMKGEFESGVRELIDKALPSFDLTWTDDYDNQQGMVYHVKDKVAMVCFNVPRTFKDGTPYRNSPESEDYRDMLTQAMIDTAERLNIPYKLF